MNWISGVRLPWAVASAIPTTAGFIAVSGWLLSNIDQPFNVQGVAVMYIFFLLLAILWRAGAVLIQHFRNTELPSLRQRILTSATDLARGHWVLPAIGATAGSWLIIKRCVEIYGELDRGFGSIVQGWDVHWHASALRFIRETQVADPTRMGELLNIDGHYPSFYPIAWHAMGALLSEILDIHPIAMVNIFNMIVPAVCMPISVALLVWIIIGNRSFTTQLGAGIAASLVFVVPVLYWIPTYVGMWPYSAGIAMTGIVAALYLKVVDAPQVMFATAFGFAGITAIHPAPVTVIVCIVGFWWLFHRLITGSANRKLAAHTDDAPTPTNPDSSRLRDTLQHVLRSGTSRLYDVALLAIPVIAATAMLLPQLLAGLKQNEEVAEYLAPDETTHSDAWRAILFMGTRHTDQFSQQNWWWLIVLGVIGIVGAVALRRRIWFVFYFLFSSFLAVHQLSPYSGVAGKVFSIIGGLHYSSAHRLVIPVIMMELALAGIGVALILQVVTGLFWWKKPLLRGVAGAVVIGSVGAMSVVAVPAAEKAIAEGTEFAVGSIYNQRTVTKEDLVAFEWLAKQPHAYDGKILGEYSDGHGWMYAYNGLPSVSRHYLLPHTDPKMPSVKIYHYPELIGAGNHGDSHQQNDVDKAVEELGLTYIFLSPPTFWHFQQHNISRRIYRAPGLTLVYQDKDVRIFAVNAKFTDAELTRMREQSPEPLATLVTKGDVGAAQPGTTEAKQPYYHRALKPSQVDADTDEILRDDQHMIAEQWRHYDKLVGRQERGQARL